MTNKAVRDRMRYASSSIGKLKAENARLRDALREISSMDWKQADTLELAIQVATEALENENGQR